MSATASGSSTGGSGRFVVQRHRARRLHYDFRLEVGGVLVSWAVPRGPTLDPSMRRAAYRVEDHPIEYLHFEGVIPAGGYGAGDVIVWDTGTWQPTEDVADPDRALADGELHLDIEGTKLRGRFVLVRTRRDASGKDQWLLLHKRDKYAVDGWNAEDHPASALTGRTNDQVKADPDQLWRSDLPAARAVVPLKPSPATVSDAELRQLDAIGSRGVWSVFGRDVPVSNLDKVLFPPRPGEEPIRKRELLRYAAQIAPTVLPYLTRRVLNMHRYPDGAQAKGSGTRRCPTTRRTGCPAGPTRRPTPARRRPIWSSTSRLRRCGRPTSARWSGTPGRRGSSIRTSPRTR